MTWQESLTTQLTTVGLDEARRLVEAGYTPDQVRELVVAHTRARIDAVVAALGAAVEALLADQAQEE